jgi:hypothetical protein
VTDRIAACADAIWQALGGLAEINILRLSEHLGERSTLTYQALGWLAREGRVQYEQRGSQVFVSLSDPERQKFDESRKTEEHTDA